MERSRLEYIWLRIYFHIKDYIPEAERTALLDMDDDDLAVINAFVRNAIASLPEDGEA